MGSTARFYFALTAAAAALSMAVRPALAQEVLDDQDPVDLDWVPAWDTPFWPAPTGAALEIAAGHTALPTNSSGLGRTQTGEGAYVLALLTLPFGARGRRADAAAEPTEADAEGDGAPLLDQRGARLAQAAGTSATASSSQGASGPTRMAVPGGAAASPDAPRSVRDSGVDAAPTSAGAAIAEADVGEAEGARARRRPEVPLDLLRTAIEQAERAAGLGASMRRLSALGRRSRWSGLSPELRLRGALGIDQTRSIDSAGIVPGDETLRDASDSLVEIRLTFHLERLLFAGQEVALERARQQLLAERTELHAAVGRELLAYRRALQRLEDEELLDEDRADFEFDAERARLALFLLTDGWFRGEETWHRYVGEGR